MKSKSGNKKLWIAVIIFVLMIAGAIGNHSDNKKEKPDRESSVATETQTETETESNTEPGGDTEDFVTRGVISNTYKTDGSSAGQMQVHFIDVGQGDAALIACDGHYMLIDAGNNDKGTTVQSYLMSQGVEKLDYVIGTHPDADHIGGLDVVIYKFDCDTIIMPDVANDTRTYDDVVQAMKSKGYQTTYPVVGETYTLGGATFTIVAPNADYGNDMNDWSVGVLVQNGNNRFLFTGDAEEKAEEDILNNGIDIDKYKFSTTTRTEFRKKLKLSDKDIAVCHVGAFEPWKNHKFLIDVFDEIKKENSGYKLFLFGINGTTQESILSLINERRLEDTIRFMGTADDINNYLQAMDLMLLPSLYEGFPVTVVEWQANGLPCIVSDTITKDVKITDLVKQLSIEDGTTIWKNEILKHNNEVDVETRKSYYIKVSKAGYNIKNNVSSLKEHYIERLGDN